MVDNYRGAQSAGSLFPSDDGLAKVAELFVSLAGKELNQEGVQTLLFLQQNGSRDLADAILESKMYQASAGDLKNFIEKLSPAQHAKDMMEAQTKARADAIKGV